MTYRQFITLVALVVGLLGFGLAPVAYDAESRSPVECGIVLRNVIRQAPQKDFQPPQVVSAGLRVAQTQPVRLIEPVPPYSPRSPPLA
ncbi:MAG: hypothetical protein PCFJNLEI_00350 [Verrucomicrobiae bacterium]|nr:hypothetical protein [Verrucomicrobiae bacterium]